MLHKLRQGIAGCQLARCSLLVGVSGGADSVALLLGLLDLRRELEFELRVAHVDHGLRGADSQADAEWVAALAAKQQLPCTVVTVPPESELKRRTSGIEETARKIRLQAMEQLAVQYGCTRVVLAHTADDQAETVLHHLLRGTGLTGLRGIPSVRRLRSGVILARPLLRVTRAEILDELATRQQDYRVDRTNADPVFTRNRIRHELLPLLAEQYNPRVREALLRLAEQGAQWHAWLQQQGMHLLQQGTLERGATHWRGARDQWLISPRLVQQEALRQLWDDFRWPRRHLGERQWNLALDTIEHQGRCQLPGKIWLEARDQLLYLRRDELDSLP